MMYHAESFVKLGFTTYVVGYKGANVISTIFQARFIYLTNAQSVLGHLPFLVLAPIKVLLQVYTILDALLFKIPHPPEFILVQNPPTIPTLALVLLVSKLRGCKVIIDWHNLGYSILALKLGDHHILVKIAKWFEAKFGRSAYAHLFVTKAMCDRLTSEWDLIGQKVVLHDRPPHHFHSALPSETHELFVRIVPSLFEDQDVEEFLPYSSPPYSTPFTEVQPSSQTPPEDFSSLLKVAKFDMPVLRSDRPALLVTSTSWTPDEDFGMLIRALELYDKRARNERNLPKVCMMITGKGPLRKKYMEELREKQKNWDWVRCVSAWLESEDYPILLGSADLGISLHSSSSGLDLPMKVVDMFGSGLPVCALNFTCLDELVKEGVNGLVFEDAEGLATHLENLLSSFPKSEKLLALKESVQHASSGHNVDWEWGSWEDNWTSHIKPLLVHDTFT